MLILDQLFKHWINQAIPLGHVKRIIPGFLSLTNLKNDGAAWSLLAGKQTFFLVITVIALSILIYLLFTQRQYGWYRWGITLMITGTIGNLIDRLSNHFVTDMIQVDFINFPIFNIADMCLTIGVLILMVAILRDKRIED